MKGSQTTAKFYLSLVIFSLAGQIAWVVENMYFNVFVYKMFHASAAAISVMVSASAIAATVTTLLIGALSDRLGKRKVFICSGYILWGVSICSFALLRSDFIMRLVPAAASAASVGVSLVIVMDCVMTFFGSAANDACFNAWLTDSTTPGNRGFVEGINSMMPLLAILVVFGGFMGFDLDLPDSWTTIYLIIGIGVLLLGIAGFFLITDSHVPSAANRNYFKNIFYGFRPSVVRQNPVLYTALAAFAAFNISIQVFMPYLILYYNVSLGMENYVLIMAPAILIAAVFTFFYGRLYDRHGFRSAVVPAMLLLMLGYLLLYLFRGTAMVFVGSLLMMCGYLSGMAVFGAVLRDYTPTGCAGMFQGLRITGQVLIPGVIGPAIGAAVLRGAETIVGDDGTVNFIPNARIFLAALTVTVLVWLVLAAVFRLVRGVKCHAV